MTSPVAGSTRASASVVEDAAQSKSPARTSCVQSAKPASFTTVSPTSERARCPSTARATVTWAVSAGKVRSPGSRA